MKDWQKQLEEGQLDGETIVTHILDVTVDNINPIIAGETQSLLGLILAFEELTKAAQEDPEVTVQEILIAAEMVVSTYTHVRRQEIERALRKRDVTEGLLETASITNAGGKLH